MPSNMVKSFAKRTGHPVAEVESKWAEAKKSVTGAGTPESHRLFYPKVVTALKRMLGMKEDHIFLDKFMRMLSEECLDEAQPKKNQLVPPHEKNIAGQMKDSIDDGYNWIVAATQAMRQHGINRDIAVEIFKRRFGVHPRSHQTRVQRGSRHDAPDPKDPAA